MEIIFVFFATQRYSILQNFIYFEYFSVKFGLPLHRPRIGPRRGGHTPQPHVPPGIFEPDALAYGRFAAPRDRTQRIGGFLAGGDEGAAGRLPAMLSSTSCGACTAGALAEADEEAAGFISLSVTAYR